MTDAKRSEAKARGGAYVEVLPVHYKAAVHALREHGRPLDLEAAQLIELAHISKPLRQHRLAQAKNDLIKGRDPLEELLVVIQEPAS